MTVSSFESLHHHTPVSQPVCQAPTQPVRRSVAGFCQSYINSQSSRFIYLPKLPRDFVMPDTRSTLAELIDKSQVEGTDLCVVSKQSLEALMDNITHLSKTSEDIIASSLSSHVSSTSRTQHTKN